MIGSSEVDALGAGGQGRLSEEMIYEMSHE